MNQIMKNKILSIVASAFAVLAAVSCSKTSGLTEITYYPVIELDGDATVIIGVGEDYIDPGYSASLNGADITADVKVSDNIDNTVPGIYTVSYSAANELGFLAAEYRTVVVVNEGQFDTVYTGDVIWAKHYVGAPIIISDNDDGTYTIDDILAGYYFYGMYPGYEPTYDFHAEAVLVLNADGTISKQGAVGDWYFGDDVTLTSGSFDSATGVVSYEGEFAGAPYTVVLTPITK